MQSRGGWLPLMHWVTQSMLVGLLAAPVVGQAQTGLDPKWIAYNRAGAPNSPLQCFTPANVAVTGGNLVLTTKAEQASCVSIDIPPSGCSMLRASKVIRPGPMTTARARKST